MVSPWSEEALAAHLRQRGRSVRLRHGRYWQALKPGFYGPVHWLARLTPEQAQRPGPCWGFLAGLDDRFSNEANASIPVHVIPDLAAYGVRSLPKSTRTAHRRLSDRGVRIVHVTDARIFHDQGYEVMREWRVRKGLSLPTMEQYLTQAEWRLESGAWLALAAMRDDELLGYTWVWAVEHAAYLHEYAVLTSAMSEGLRLSALLNFEAVAVLQRTETVSEVSAGLAQTEHAGALAYKVEQGYPIKDVPARLVMPWPVARLLQTSRPHAYYRLSGTKPGR